MPAKRHKTLSDEVEVQVPGRKLKYRISVTCPSGKTPSPPGKRWYLHRTRTEYADRRYASWRAAQKARRDVARAWPTCTVKIVPSLEYLGRRKRRR
jgi:hypothetical protein